MISAPAQQHYQPGATPRQVLPHAEFRQEARRQPSKEAVRAQKTGYHFAQSDARNASVLARPGVRDLMNIVDFIVAHPLDATWWRTVVDKYVSAHPEEVARHIRERNATRGQRERVRQ